MKISSILDEALQKLTINQATRKTDGNEAGVCVVVAVSWK